MSLPIAASSVPQTTLLPLPVVQSPAPGATVPASGFQVQFTSPPGTLYTQLILECLHVVHEPL